jgi:hypothetical protein
MASAPRNLDFLCGTLDEVKNCSHDWKTLYYQSSYNVLCLVYTVHSTSWYRHSDKVTCPRNVENVIVIYCMCLTVLSSRYLNFIGLEATFSFCEQQEV